MRNIHSNNKIINPKDGNNPVPIIDLDKNKKQKCTPPNNDWKYKRPSFNKNNSIIFSQMFFSDYNNNYS